MTAEAYQRARRPEQKQQRQDAILGAAGDLALRDGVRSVSLADIADRVGIHKSALLRYFETREQIFLELTAGAWRDWLGALLTGLEDAAPGDPGLVADVLARSFAERPLLCDLIAHTPLNLERNVSVGSVRSYKLTSLGVIEKAAELIHGVLADRTVTECREVVSALASLAGATWQIANPPAALTELYASDPALARACVDLEPRLRRTADILLAGGSPQPATAYRTITMKLPDRAQARTALADSVVLALASLVTYLLATRLLSWVHSVSPADDMLGGLWAVIAAIFVNRSSYSDSLSAAVSRIAATLVSFVYCLIYLAFLPFHTWALALLVGVSALTATLIGRPGDAITAAITTTVVLLVAAVSPHGAWEQPILRLADTVIGVAVGIASAWLDQHVIRPRLHPPGGDSAGPVDASP